MALEDDQRHAHVLRGRPPGSAAADLRGAGDKRVLEYGVRAPVFYGRPSTGANRRKRFSTKTYRKLVLFLQKSSKVSGNLREFKGECNLEFL